MEFLFSLLFVSIVAAVICSRTVRLVHSGSSIVVFQNGQAIKVVDSTATKMTLLLPFLQTSKSVDISKQVLSIPDFYDDVDPVTPLVRGGFEYHITDPLKTVNNARLKDDMQALIVNSFQRVLVDATIAECLLQKSQIENKTIELTKLKSAMLGTAVTAVNIRSFPRYHLLLYQIVTLPYVVYWQLVEEVQ